MNAPTVEKLFSCIADDRHLQQMINPLDADAIYSVYEEFDAMKRALSLSVTAIIDGISSSAIDDFEGMCALAEINNIQKLLNGFENHVTWAHTAGAQGEKIRLRAIK